MTTATQTDHEEINIDRFSKQVQEIIGNAQTLADTSKHKEVLPVHLFSAAIKNTAIIKTLQAVDVSEFDMASMVDKELMGVSRSPKPAEASWSRPALMMLTNLEKGTTSKNLIELEMFFKELVSKQYKPNHTIFQHFNIELEDFLTQLQGNRKSGFAQMDPAMLLKMEEFIGKRVIGQKEAVHAVSRVVRRGKVGLNDPGKPIGSLLFLGPSGVGKTEVAKALTEFLYGDEKNLVRFDMSEFSEKHMAQRLIGSPPGYVGSQEGGQLTEAVKRNPQAVILFDEMEKAHGDVYNMLLQVLDDGRLTDGVGRTADFSQTIILMTSNIGSKKIIDAGPELMNDKEALKDMVLDEVKKFLRPEMINRLDEMIVFQSMSKLEVAEVVEIQLRVVEKLMKARDMHITFDQNARNVICEGGYDVLMGARPVKRLILKRIKDPLAEKILDGTYKAGSKIHVSYNNGFQFN